MGNQKRDARGRFVSAAGESHVVKDDPVKPWKAYIGAAITFLGLLWANVQGAKSLNSWMDWATIVVPTIIAFGGIYGLSNPKVAVRSRLDKAA